METTKIFRSNHGRLRDHIISSNISYAYIPWMNSPNGALLFNHIHTALQGVAEVAQFLINFYTSKHGLKSRCKNPADHGTFKHSFMRKHTTVLMWDRRFRYAQTESSCCWIYAFPAATQKCLSECAGRGELSPWKRLVFCSSQKVWLVFHSLFSGNLLSIFALSLGRQ